MKRFVACFVFCAVCSAQTAPTPLPNSGDVSKLPTYLVGIGGELNPAGVLANLAVRIGSTPVYSWTTLDTPVKQTPVSTVSAAGQSTTQVVSSIRSGVAYVAAHSGSCFLFFLGDAGVVTGAGTATLGAYSGGGGVYCSPAKLPNLYVGPVVRAVKISSSTVTPIAELMVSWSF